MFITNMRGGKALVAEQKRCKFKKSIFKTKTLEERFLKKNKV